MTAEHEKYVLAVDLGTSGSKTALVSIRGEVIDFEFKDTPLRLLPGGGAEQDPDDWWEAIMSTSKKLLSKGLVKPENVAAVCCSCQWSGTVAVDREGSHLGPAIIWMDSRGADHLKGVMSGLVKFDGFPVGKLLTWLRLTGGVPAPSGKDPVGHIMFIKDERPDVFKRTYKFLEPKDYLNLRFTGKFASSHDAITLHWVTDNRDLANIRYNDKLLAITGLERDKLPDLRRSIDLLGPIKKEVARELGLRDDVPVVMGSPDVHSAAVGSGAVRDFEGHLYIGTSSWISAHVPFKKTDLLHSLGSFPSPIPTRYLILDENETAGKCLTWLRDNIVYHKDELLREEQAPHVYRLFDHIVERVKPGASKVIFTPWLWGERTPVENNHIRAGFYNISLETTREEIVRAVFEGVAFNQKWVLGYVEKFMGRKMAGLSMIGGGANSPVWCQIMADVLDRTIKQVKDPIQANARGAAFIASVALGYLNWTDIPDCIRIENTFSPNPDNRRIYDEMFREYLNIYKNNNAMYARLNRGPN
ncbi:MAG: FGGY-family carbohydrate kinase [Pseudomonadota bacterium]